MAARAMWKGSIGFGDVRVPVKLYAAVQERTVHFNLLHATDESPVHQKMVNPATGDEVPRDQIRKGVAVDAHTFVVLDDEELEKLEPPASRDIEVTSFLPADAIDQAWYDRPYYLGPDGDADGYVALAAALRDKQRVGLARWVMRKRAYVGTIRAEDHHLALVTLRHADEVVPADKLKPPAGRKLEKKEVQLAEQLVAALEDEFDPSRYHDEYRERVMELIEKKRKGKPVRLKKVVEKRPPKGTLAGALRASLAAAKKDRHRAA